MNLLDKLKKIESKRIISYLLISIILIYSLSFIILFCTVSISLYQTIESIKVADNYYIIVPSSENPDVRISFRVSNKGFFDLTSFQINTSIDLEYYKDYSNEKIKVSFFENLENYNRLVPMKTYYYVIQGNKEDFNISALADFEENVNMSKDINFLINIQIKGSYFFNKIPFKLIVKNLNPECPTCS